LACFGALSVGIAFAIYPERPVTIVVPFAPGGANDVVIRAIQQPLAEAPARGRTGDRRAAPLHPLHHLRRVGIIGRRAASDGPAPPGDRLRAVLARVRR